MKITYAVAALAVLSACADMTPEQKAAATAATVAQAQLILATMDAKGVSYAELGPTEQAVVTAACVLGPTYFPEHADTLTATCQVALAT